MANIKSSKKRIIISNKRRKKNKINRSVLKNIIKKIKIFILNNDKINSLKSYVKLQSFLDKLRVKNKIHINKASKIKSKFIKLINCI